ncbi:hypothetical protein FRC10_011381 [Ceratobasidium sp. 414]|nr:hypothetical protein FRC10_011381 [Ceratobasidium sp. 414]
MPSINASALDALRAALSPGATINLPGDASFSTKRWALNAEKPAAVVACPAVPEDVVQLLAFVQGKGAYSAQEQLDFAVKGGGHNPSGASSSDGGLVIDLQPNMHGVRVDPDAKLAYVKGGSVWAEVEEATIEHGTDYWIRRYLTTLMLMNDQKDWLRLLERSIILARVSGTADPCATISNLLTSLTLGGGFGWLCSQHGLVIDNLVQATVVTASGDILTVSENENQDLHWAIRGGGGNFGVVTEFVYRLHEQPLIFPSPLLEAVISEANAWMAERTNLESALVAFVVGPGDQPVLLLQLVYNGDAEEGARKYERFVKLGPVVNQSEAIPYIKLNAMLNHHAPHGENRIFRGNFLPAIPSGIPPSLVGKMFASYAEMVKNNPTAKGSTAILEFYHPDKVASVSSSYTAYPHRDPAFNIVHGMQWIDPAFADKAPGMLRALDDGFMVVRSEHFAPELVQRGGYTNYLDEESQMASAAVANRRFGGNFPRLAEAKRKYDPGNLFSKWFPITDAPAA